MKKFISYLASFLNIKCKCRHSRALLKSNEGYCPDCGEYLKKYYYVLRCKCCNHKREAARAVFGEYNEVVPVSKYCPECGGEQYYIEKYEKLNFVDINYAIEVKEIFNPINVDMTSTEVWVEAPDEIKDDNFNENPSYKALGGSQVFLIQTSCV